jgi:hypothetical protein
MQSNSCRVGLGAHPHTHAGHDHEMDRSGTLDSLGMAASLLCMVHCISMPLLISVLPTLGLSFLEGHLAHHLLAFFVVGFALAAVLPAYLRHRRSAVLVSMIVGVGLVLMATFGAGTVLPESYELPLITLGNMLVVFTHWRNKNLVTA